MLGDTAERLIDHTMLDTGQRSDLIELYQQPLVHYSQFGSLPKDAFTSLSYYRWRIAVLPSDKKSIAVITIERTVILQEQFFCNILNTYKSIFELLSILSKVGDVCNSWNSKEMVTRNGNRERLFKEKHLPKHMTV